jgi:RNA recognition motif-containing protein
VSVTQITVTTWEVSDPSTVRTERTCPVRPHCHDANSHRLYVGKIRESADKHQTEETIRRHFGEWGHIVKMNILHGRGVAFVTYDQEHHAEFAKEAMANQSMDGDEILNVRYVADRSIAHS